MAKTYDEAVTECKLAFADSAPAWPSPLIRFLDEPPDSHRVFAWVISCTRRLLDLLEESTPELERQLALFRSYVDESPNVEVIQDTLERLWVQRSPYESAKTAITKLFAALINYRERYEYRHLSCTASITVLVDTAVDREQAFLIVLREFASFVSDEELP